IGVSLAVAVWGIEQVALARAREHRRTELRNTLQDARRLLVQRGTNAATAASGLAGSPSIQDAFVSRDVSVLRSVSARRPDVGFVLWDGPAVGQEAVPGLDVAVAVYGGGRPLGKVIVSASPTVSLLDSARARHQRVALAFVVGRDVRVTSPAGVSRDLA